MNRFQTFVRAALVCASLAAVGGAPAMACPPSEGDFDFEYYDISGDGMVQLPEGVKVTAVARTSTTDGEGKVVVDKRIALVVQDPSHENARVLTMRLTPRGAEEVKDWLADAVEAQAAWLKEHTATEKPGVECSLDAKRCREMGAAKGGKKATLPAMWVTVNSAAARHGWSMLGAETACKGNAAADPRIAITTYDRSEGSRPLTLRLDSTSAKALLADLSRAIDENAGKKVAPAQEVEKPDAGVSAS